MKLVQGTGVFGIVLTVLTASACAANSKNGSAQRAEERAEQEEREAREARADADKARHESAEAQEEAREAERARRAADDRAVRANQQAALAEMQANREAYGSAPHRKGAAEVQPERAVLFAPGSAELSLEARARLDDIAQVIRARAPERGVVVEGYSDDTGSEDSNADITQRRAKVAADYLVKKGVARDRITTRGLGSQNPVSREDTDRGRALNRRRSEER